ncbi:MAG: leucine-rich repeat protein [Eubacterium sp.]
MKKIISLFLSITIFITAIPLSGFVDINIPSLENLFTFRASAAGQTTIEIENEEEKHLVGSLFAVSASYKSDTYEPNSDTISYEIKGDSSGLIVDGSMSCIGTKEDGIVSIPLKAVKVGSYTVTMKTIDGATDSITILISDESYDVYLAQEILKRNSFLTATDTIIKSSDYGWMQSNEAMIYFNDLSAQEYVETMIIRVLIGKAIDEKNILESYAKATSLVTQCMSGIKGIYSTITEETTFDSINDASIEKSIKDYVSGFYQFNVFDTLSATIKGATTISQAVKQASYYRVISDILSAEEISNMLSVTASSLYESEYRNTLVAAFGNIIDIVENTDLKISEYFANTAIDYGVNTLKSLTLGVAKAFAFNSLNAVAPGLGSVISAGMTVYEICKAIDNLSKNKLETVEINLSAVSALCEVFKHAVTSYASSFENNPDKYAKIIVENYKYLLTADRIAVEIQQENIDILSKSLLDSISVQPAFSLSQLLKNIDLYGGKTNPLYSQYLVNERYPVMLDTLESIIDNEYLYVKTVTEDFLYYSYGMDLYEYTSDLWDIETKYIITLDSNFSDENNSFKKEFVYYAEGETLDERCMPFLRPGYDFVGWYTDKECTKEYDVQKEIKNNFILYAKWEKQLSYRNNDDGTATITSLNSRQSSLLNVVQNGAMESETVLSKIGEAEAVVPLFVDGKAIVSMDSNTISSNCSSVYISEIVENIATDAINKSTVIYCWTDSYAYQFAKDNGYDFVLIDKNDSDIEETPAEYFRYSFNSNTKKATINGLIEDYNPVSLTIPSIIDGYTVTSISQNAFRGLTNLSNVYISDGISSIGNYCFENCGNLISVSLPESIILIGDSAFNYCNKLKKVYITDISAWCNISFLNVTSNPLYYAENLIWNGSVLTGEIEIPNTVSKIPNYTFKNSKIKQVSLPETIDSIGGHSFYNCSSLVSINLPDSITNIGVRAFKNCSSLTKIKLPYGISVIRMESFYDCTSLAEITIPPNVQMIGSYAFGGCQSLRKVNIENIESWCSVNLWSYEDTSPFTYGADLYLNGEKLETLIIPNNVDTICKYTFAGCGSVKSVIIPESVKEIETSVFAHCGGLKDVVISDSVTSIGSSCFAYCESLKNVNIPLQLLQISDCTFFGCSSIEEIYIPDNIKSIGLYSFRNCTSLVDITIPDSVTHLEQYAFENCSSAKNIVIGDGVTGNIYGAFTNLKSLETIIVGDSVESIERPDSSYNAFFENCKNLKSVVLGESITKLDSETFSGCSALCEVNIPNGITQINNSTFYNCSSLENIIIPSSITSIGDYAFYGCVSLNNINIENNIKSIGSCAFGNCTSLTQFIIPEDLTIIERNTFKNCSSLDSVYISDSVKEILPGAFYGCVSLKNLKLGNNIEFIRGERYYFTDDLGAFQGCASLNDVVIPNSTKEIDRCSFKECMSLKSITIGDSLEKIGGEAFYGCSALKDIYISDSIMHIGQYAFDNTAYYNDNNNWNDGVLYLHNYIIATKNDIKSCSIRNGTITISSSAFDNCLNIKTLVIPKTIKNLGGMNDYSFLALRNVFTEIFYEGTESEWKQIFSHDFHQGRIHYNAPNNHYILVNSVDATCTEEGKNEYECSCGYKKADYIEPLGHNYEFVEKTEPTCDWHGYTKYYCNRCEQYFYDDYVDELGHTQGILLEAVSPTCTTIGYNKYICSVCNNEFFEYIEKLDHSKELVENREATCSVGATARYYCSRGDHYIWEQTSSANGHNYVDGICKICGMSDDWLYSFSVDCGGICIEGYSGDESEIVIPDMIEGYRVTKIGNYAFSNNSNITSIVFPDTLINIGDGVLRGCSSISSITIPENVTKIGDSAFAYTNIERVVFNATKCSMSYIDDDYFLYGDCGNNAIYWGGGGHFPYCKEIVFGDNVEYIPSTFSTLNDNLTSIEFSSSLETIGYCAFYGCENLSSITISNHKLTIENWAFDSCKKLNDVYYSGTKSQWSNVNIKKGNDALLNSNIRCADGAICKEHNWDDGVVQVIPTCKEKGKLLCTCLICGITKTEEIPMQHNFIDGVCGTCGMLEEDCIESEHPYTNNYDNTWTINKPNAKRIAITFSKGTETESCDYIYLYDSENNQVGKYSGTNLAGKRVSVKGDTVKIRLVTDSSVTYYGFAVTNVQVYYDDCPHLETELRNQKSANCADSGYTGDICCIECDEIITKGEIIPKTDNHNMVENIITPTCTEQGYTEYYCRDCDYSYKTDYVSSTGIHTYVNGFCKDCKAKDPDYVLPVINSGESQTVEINNGGDYYYVTFTPKSNGSCTFYSTGDYDTYGYLYDENMNELNSNDDGGENYNFSINYDLQAGRTYIFACRMLNSYETGTFNVTLEFDKEEHVHSYVTKVVNPTCAAKGYTTYTCECGDSYIDNYVNATGHTYDRGKVTKAATCTATGVKTYTCSKCGEIKAETIAKTAHTYKTTTTKATTSKNGSVVTKCTVCGYVSKTTSIPYVKTVTLSATSYTYDGKVKKPTVTVKDSKGNKIASSNYTVTYQSSRKSVGKYSVKVTFKGNYSGTKTLYFTINPKGTSISSATAKSKGFTVKWKKQATQTTGYEIQYATDSKFTKNKKTVIVSKNSTTSKTISKLSAKKKYYVRIRTYKTVKVNGKSTKIYSSWSKAKYVTTKK